MDTNIKEIFNNGEKIELETTHISKSIEDLNHENCIKRADELWELIKNNKIVLPIDERFPIGKEVWILEYGDIPTKTTIRKKDLGVKYPKDTYSEEMPCVEWKYQVKGNRQEYFSDSLYETRKDAERHLAQNVLETFYTRFSAIVKKNGFTKADFPQIEIINDLKLLEN